MPSDRRKPAVRHGDRTPAGYRFLGVPYVVLLLTLLLTAAATYYVAEATRTKDRLRFENAVQQTQDMIQARLETYISTLRGVTGLMAADSTLDRRAFRAYVERLHLARNYPGIQGVGLSWRVTPSNKLAFTASVRRQDMPTFRIWPESRRDEYHTVVFLEPMTPRNQAAIGFDMFSEPVRHAAIEQARDRGAPTASGKVTLVQEIGNNKQAGFLIYVPVYRGGRVPPDVVTRRAELLGFACAPFRADDLLQGIFGTQAHPRISFQLYDGTEQTPERLLHRSDVTGDTTAYRPRFTTRSLLTIAGRPWTVAYATRPAFESAGVHSAPYVLLTGLLISALLFGATRTQVMARAVAEHSAAELRENEARQRVFLRDVLASVTEGKLRLCSSAADLPIRLAPAGEPIELAPPTLRHLRERAQQIAISEGLAPERWQDLVLAVGEAAMNAVVHAGGGRGQVACGPDGMVQVWIEDQGSGIDMQRLPRATLERGFTTAGSLGHGFWLILQMADRVWLLTGPQGTTVVLEQERTAIEPGWLALK